MLSWTHCAQPLSPTAQRSRLVAVRACSYWFGQRLEALSAANRWINTAVLCAVSSSASGQNEPGSLAVGTAGLPPSADDLRTQHNRSRSPQFSREYPVETDW